jgi:hypothetical protein
MYSTKDIWMNDLYSIVSNACSHMSRNWEGNDRTFKYVRGEEIGNDTYFLELLQVGAKRSAWKHQFKGPLSVGRAVLCHPNLKPFLLVSLTKGPHTHQGVVCDPTTKDEFYTIAAARLTLAPHNSNSWSHDLRQQVHKRCCFRVTIYFFPTVGGTIRGVMQKPNVEASKIPHTERKTR